MNSSKIKYRIDLASLLENDTKCNLNCKYCHKDYFTLPYQLPASKSVYFADTIKKLEKVYIDDPRPRKIHFSGRVEPLLVPKSRFSEEIDLINTCFPHFSKSMTTNGFLLKNYAQFLSDKGISKLNVSVHNNSFKSSKYIHGIKAATETDINVSLNSIVTFENVEGIPEIINFAIEQKTSIKFFSVLGLTNTENTELFNKTVKIISELTSSKPCFSSSDNRYIFNLSNKTRILLTSPDNKTNRPQECFECEMFKECNEGCWDSIRITSSYIKPCGVRNDNAITLHDAETENMKATLLLAGKGQYNRKSEQIFYKN